MDEISIGDLNFASARRVVHIVLDHKLTSNSRRVKLPLGEFYNQVDDEWLVIWVR